MSKRYMTFDFIHLRLTNQLFERRKLTLHSYAQTIQYQANKCVFWTVDKILQSGYQQSSNAFGQTCVTLDNTIFQKLQEVKNTQL